MQVALAEATGCMALPTEETHHIVLFRYHFYTCPMYVSVPVAAVYTFWYQRYMAF